MSRFLARKFEQQQQQQQQQGQSDSVQLSMEWEQAARLQASPARGYEMTGMAAEFV